MQINQLQTFANSDSGAVSNPHVWPTLKHAVLFASFAHSLRFQTHPYGLCIWLWYFESERPVCPWDSPCHVIWYAHNQINQLWLQKSGHFTRGLKCIQLSFQTLSTHLKPSGPPTRQQALNTHFNTAPFQKDVDRATNFHQTPKKNKNEFWNCHLMSFGNAGPSSQANLYKSMPRSAFKSMTLWMNHGVQKVEPPESRPSLRGPQPRDVDALACAKEL